MTQSCESNINPKKFVPGLKIANWKAVDQVGFISVYNKFWQMFE